MGDNYEENDDDDDDNIDDYDDIDENMTTWPPTAAAARERSFGGPGSTFSTHSTIISTPLSKKNHSKSIPACQARTSEF